MTRWVLWLRARALFSVLEGNARVIVFTEGIAAVSFKWYSAYLPLYMLALGVSEVQVGILSSILISTQFISTMFGGYMADRLGRKRVLVVFDILCWGLPMFLYAIARNPWYFVIGRLINGFVYVVLPSFECLFVEDVPVERRTAVFGAMQFLIAAASLLAPVAGYMVAAMGIVPAGRVIMATCMAVSIGIAVARQFTLQETRMGRERMSATATAPLRHQVRAYMDTARAVGRNRTVRTFLMVRIVEAFVTTMWTTYAMIYLSDPRGVGLTKSVLSVLPFVSAFATMGMILLAADRMRAEQVFGNLIAGQVLWFVAALCFVLSPAGTVWFAVLWAAAGAVSTALFRPAQQSYWANIVADDERAQVFSVSSALMSLCTLPAGPLAGVLYIRSPRSPFWLGIALQAITLGLILWLGIEQKAISLGWTRRP